jgi:surfactin synthase thioesterase subunit
MEIFIAIARYWAVDAVIGVFTSEADALAAIEEVKTWQEKIDEDEEVFNLYEGWHFTVQRCRIGEILVTHPDEE